jgi:hypothetical protein
MHKGDLRSIDFYILPNGDWVKRSTPEEIDFSKLKDYENHDVIFSYSDGLIKKGFIHDIQGENFQFTSLEVSHRNEN